MGTQYRYAFTLDTAFEFGVPVPLAIGQTMEFEASQFLDGAPGGRQNYYGTTGLYAVGVGGLLPWHCRVTQYAHLGPLGAVSEACARRALVEHAGVTQRHGR